MLIYDVDTNKIIVFSNFPFGKKGFKYFIGYKDNENVVPLCLRLQKLNGYRKNWMKVSVCVFDKIWRIARII